MTDTLSALPADVRERLRKRGCEPVSACGACYWIIPGPMGMRLVDAEAEAWLLNLEKKESERRAPG